MKIETFNNLHVIRKKETGEFLTDYGQKHVSILKARTLSLEDAKYILNDDEEILELQSISCMLKKVK